MDITAYLAARDVLLKTKRAEESQALADYRARLAEISQEYHTALSALGPSPVTHGTPAPGSFTPA